MLVVLLINKEKSLVISSALKDIKKRNIPIVSCIGIMDFSSDIEIDLNRYRNTSLIRRTINDDFALKKSKTIIKKYGKNPIVDLHLLTLEFGITYELICYFVQYNMHNRVAGGFSPPAPTPPCVRVRTGRFTNLDNE